MNDTNTIETQDDDGIPLTEEQRQFLWEQHLLQQCCGVQRRAIAFAQRIIRKDIEAQDWVKVGQKFQFLLNRADELEQALQQLKVLTQADH